MLFLEAYLIISSNSDFIYAIPISSCIPPNYRNGEENRDYDYVCCALNGITVVDEMEQPR